MRGLQRSWVAGAACATGACLLTGLGAMTSTAAAAADFLDIFGEVIDNSTDIDTADLGAVLDFGAGDAALAVDGLEDPAHGLDELIPGSLSALLHQVSELDDITSTADPVADVAGAETWLYGAGAEDAGSSSAEPADIPIADNVADGNAGGIGSVGADFGPGLSDPFGGDAAPTGLQAVGLVGIADTNSGDVTITTDAPGDTEAGPGTETDGTSADTGPAGGEVTLPGALPANADNAATGSGVAQADVTNPGADGGTGFRESAGDNMTRDGGNGDDGGAGALR